jgi:hypothetical protein
MLNRDDEVWWARCPAEFLIDDGKLIHYRQPRYNRNFLP